MGISPEALPLLFEPFQQGDASATRRHGGTGLGLAISKRMVELMGGDITVSSILSAGSIFRFSIPLAHQRTLEDRSWRPRIASSPPPAGSSSSPREKNIRACSKATDRKPGAPMCRAGRD